MLIKCECCGKVFNRKPSHIFNHVFCSRECYGKWYAQYAKGKKNPSWKGGKITKTCDVCGKTFKVFPCFKNALFCSVKCRGESQKGKSWGIQLFNDAGERLSEMAKKRWKKPSFREKMSKVLTGRKFSDEAKRKMENLWRDKEYVKHVMNGLHRKPTNPEQKIITLCKEHDFSFQYCGDGSFMIDTLNPDFIHNDGEKKVIEIFGRVFHDPEKSFFPVGWKRQYFGRISYFAQFGYDCLILWDDELRDEARVVEKIRDFASEHIELYKSLVGS